MHVSVRFQCEYCDAYAEVLVPLDEEKTESNCGCCSGSGTGRYFVDVSSRCPQDWVNAHCCGKCAEKPYRRA